MAIQTSFSPHMLFHQSIILKKPIFGKAFFRKSRVNNNVNKIVKLQIRSSFKEEIFEDHSTGIICYKDESGEMICEGFDEGPRLLKTHCSSRDYAHFLERLQRRWLQLMNGETSNEDALLGEHSFNGFNV